MVYVERKERRMDGDGGQWMRLGREVGHVPMPPLVQRVSTMRPGASCSSNVMWCAHTNIASYHTVTTSGDK